MLPGIITNLELFDMLVYLRKSMSIVNQPFRQYFKPRILINKSILVNYMNVGYVSGAQQKIHNYKC